MGKTLPPLLSYLSDELDYRIRPAPDTLGYSLFYIDLSAWKLRLTHHTPVIWVRAPDLEETTPKKLSQSLQDVVRQRSWRRRTVLVLLDGPGEDLRMTAANPLHSFVVIDKAAQEQLLQSRRPTGALLDLISSQVPISTLAPYEISSPVTGSRFFGRQYEINRILRNPDTNHAVLGIRRIGKTSLLREVKRILTEEEDEDDDESRNPHIIYLDCSDLLSTDDYIREVVRRLNPKELPRLHLQKYAFFFPNFLERMHRRHKRKIVFLLDEIDNLVIMQRGNWELFRMLRASANKGACQYIMAGFREVNRELYDINSPFYNFAEELRLNEFMTREATRLIITPMENLRVRFRNKDEIVSRIYEETAGHPNLIQYYCQIMLRRLDQTGQREITPDSLIDVYADKGFKSHLITSFMQNTQNREKAVVYALIAEDGPNLNSFTQARIDVALRKRGLVLEQAKIDRACEVLLLAGVFHQKGKEFSFTSPVFLKVLQQFHDIDYLFRKVKEEGI